MLIPRGLFHGKLWYTCWYKHCSPIQLYGMMPYHFHDDVIKWKHFPRNWPFVRGIHRWPVNSPHKGQWRGALIFSLICVWINSWINNREAGDLRRYRAHYDVIVMHWMWADNFREYICLPGDVYYISILTHFSFISTDGNVTLGQTPTDIC